MKRKITIGVLTVLIASGVCIENSAAAQANVSRSERRGPVGELTVNGKTFRLGSPTKARSEKRSSANRRVVSPDVITEPLGTPQEYSKTSGGYYSFAGRMNAYQDAGQAATIWWDGDDAYIYNLLSYKETDTYVKGTRSDNKLTLVLGQSVDNAEDFDIKIALLKTDLIVAPNPDADEDDDPEYVNYVNFVYSDDYDEVSYIIGEDGSLELDLPSLPAGGGSPLPDDGFTHLDPADYGFPYYCLGFYYTDDMQWTGDGDIFQTYYEFNYAATQVPEDLEWNYFVYVNNYDMGVLASVARDGNDLYVKGLSAYAPEAVFKATLVDENGVLTGHVPQLQFVGKSLDGYYNILTRAVKYNRGNYEFIEGDALFEVETDAEGNIVSILFDDSQAILVFNYADDEYDPYDEFPGIKLTYQESLEGTPKTPVDAYFEDHVAWLGSYWLFFTFDQFSTEENLLDVEKLYYRIFINGEPFEFVQHDGENPLGQFITMYAGFNQPTTLVPYTFNNGIDIFSDEYHLFYVALYQTDLESVGVQTVYTFGDEPTYSEVVTLDVSGVEKVSAAEVDATEYYTLDGRKVLNPDKGIFIKVDRLTDGTKRIKKEAR